MVSTLFPLKLHGVEIRRRGKSVLGPIDCTIDQGGPLMVIGPNGSGKTTLLRAIHGIERLSHGELRWARADPAQHAYVFQQPILLRRSVVANLRYPMELSGIPRKVIDDACDEWLQRTGLGDMRDVPAQRLSGGEQQKLAIARSLINGPSVLFLDEPTANLDGYATREIEALLTQASRAGTRIIMATHDMGQCKRLAQDIIFMIGGRVHEQGNAAIMQDPATDALCAFLKGDIVT
jgi:tungstate transport system ATP-binding protein